MLKDQINSDLKQAMKEKNSVKVSCLRMIIADIKNVSIDKRRELQENDIIEILQKQIKQHKDSIDSFEKGNRMDLVEKEKKELDIITEYLPEQLSDDDIKSIVQEAVKNTGASDKKDIGKVMSAIMPQLKGRADGKTVNRIVMEILSKNEN